jgi:hypothetical protein
MQQIVACYDVTPLPLLHFGRAIPRAWFAAGEPMSAAGVRTVFGKAGVRYEPLSSDGTISAVVSLELVSTPARILVRFRHPAKKRIARARVNGKPWRRFDPRKGDVDITGLQGQRTVRVDVAY